MVYATGNNTFVQFRNYMQHFFITKSPFLFHNKHHFNARRNRRRFHFVSQYNYTKFLFSICLSTDLGNEFIVVILCHFNSQLWIKNQLNSCFNRHNSLKRYFAQTWPLYKRIKLIQLLKRKKNHRSNKASGFHN